MEYKKYEYDNYTVHFFNTDKFKSILLSTIFIFIFTKFTFNSIINYI